MRAITSLFATPAAAERRSRSKVQSRTGGCARAYRLVPTWPAANYFGIISSTWRTIETYSPVFPCPPGTGRRVLNEEKQTDRPRASTVQWPVRARDPVSGCSEMSRGNPRATRRGTTSAREIRGLVGARLPGRSRTKSIHADSRSSRESETVLGGK